MLTPQLSAAFDKATGNRTNPNAGTPIQSSINARLAQIDSIAKNAQNPTSASATPTNNLFGNGQNNTGNFLGVDTVNNAASGVANAVTRSEQGVGSDLSTLIPSNPITGKNAPDIANSVNAQTQVGEAKLIEAAHNETDPTKKAQILAAYKSIYGKVAPTTAGDINPAFNKTPGQVVGDFAGMGADILASGSYGEVASGASFLPKAGEILGDTGKLTSAIPAVTGVAEQAVKQPLGQTLKDIGIKTAERTAVGAGLGYGYDVSGNLQEGKTGADAFTPGWGTVLGGGVPMVIGGIEVGAAITKDMAPRFINSLIKPKAANFSYGKDPGRTVSALGITGNNMDDFANNIAKAKNDIGSQIGAIYSAPENADIKIDATPTLDKIDTAISDAASGGKNNQGIVNTLQNIKDSLLFEHTTDADGNIVKVGNAPLDVTELSPQEAFDLKSKIADATRFTGSPSDDKAVNATLKGMYGSLSDQLKGAVSENNPEIDKLSQQYADLTSAELATRNRNAIVQRSALTSLKTGGLGVAAGTAAILTGTAALPAVLIGMSSAGLEKALESTAVKTRIAAWLGSETPGIVAQVLEQNPGIKTVLYRALPKFASQLNQ